MLRAQPARLLATDKSDTAARLLLLGREDATIGSAPGSTLRLGAAGVAGHHARIRPARGGYYLKDFRRGRGTRVNGQAVRGRIKLKHGDRISFGESAPYRFIDPDGPKRLRNRRIIRTGAAVSVLAAAVGAHAAGWDGGALAPRTIARAIDTGAEALEHRVSRVALAAPPHPASPPPPAAASGKPAATASIAARSQPMRIASARSADVKPSAAKPVTAATPAAAGSAAAKPPTASQWLDQLNFYRTMSGVPALTDARELSAAMTAHAHYLMLNYSKQIQNGEPLGNGGHDEDPSKPGYTAAGRKKSFNSQLGWGCGQYDAKAQISQWIAGPFNRFAMLDPSIVEAGFGEATKAGCWVAGLRLPPDRQEVKRYAHAVEFPPPGADLPLSWSGVEWPNPLAGCPGYAAPVGLPITLQLGRLVPTRLSAHRLTRDGQEIASCAFDSHSYRNPRPDEQEYARWELRSSGAVVVIPRQPLEAGSQYTVSITADGRPYTWSFRVSK